MEHAALDELWLEFTEGTLPALEARALAAHLESCGSCAARYQRLVAAHRASVQAGRVARQDRLSTPIPPAVHDRVLAAARTAAIRGGPRWRVWMVSGLAAMATAAAAVLLLRVEVARNREARLMSDTLALVGSPPGARGPDDELAAAARAAAERWTRGELRVRGSTVRCPGGDLLVTGLVGGEGEPIVVSMSLHDRTDVFAYGEDGRQVGSLRLVGGIRSEFLLPPLTRGEARALLDGTGCSAMVR